MTTPTLACKGCGRTKAEPTGTPDDLFPTEHCGECPPWTCETCGEKCSAVSLCSCWLSLEGLTLADTKAIFAVGDRDRSTPPTEWCDWWTEVHDLAPNLAYGWVPPELTADPSDPNPWFWHWCSQQDRWMPQAAPEHTLVSREPLHMEPSLLWSCCGTHGFVRNGQWINA